MALVVRREEGALRYAHLATGNYHPRTARLYTDFGLLTANEMCADVNEVFKQLTGLGRAGKMKHVWQSPFTLHKRIVAAIRNEAAQAAEGKPARIIAKMNALLEPQIIEELYAASAAGVKIELSCAGVRAQAGIEGLPRTSACARWSAASSSTRASSTSTTAAPRTCTSRAPTGWTAISSAASSCASRCSTRRSSAA